MCLKSNVEHQLEDIAEGGALRCQRGFEPEIMNDVCTQGVFEGGCKAKKLPMITVHIGIKSDNNKWEFQETQCRTAGVIACCRKDDGTLGKRPSDFWNDHSGVRKFTKEEAMSECKGEYELCTLKQVKTHSNSGKLHGNRKWVTKDSQACEPTE